MNRSQTVKKTVERVFQTEGATDIKAQKRVKVAWLEEGRDGARGTAEIGKVTLYRAF